MRVGVVGGGLMGTGIAEVCARSGVDVTVVEVDDAGLARAESAIERSLDRAVAMAPRRVFALPTYTALLELRALLSDRGQAREYWR